jgi:hypothetical protein
MMRVHMSAAASRGSGECRTRARVSAPSTELMRKDAVTVADAGA